MSETALWRFRLYTVGTIATFAWIFPSIWILIQKTAEVVFWISVVAIPICATGSLLLEWIDKNARPHWKLAIPAGIEVARAIARSFVAVDVALTSLIITICLIYPQIDPRTTSMAGAIIALTIQLFIASTIIEPFIIQPVKTKAAQA